MLRIITLLSCLVACSGAQAHTLLVRPNGQPLGGRLQRAVDHAHVTLPTGRITVAINWNVGEHSTGAEGASDGTSIWMVPSEADPHTLFHELGHIYDDRYLTESTRAAIAERVMYRSAPTDIYWNLAGLPDTPSEQFAELYAYAATGEGWPDHHCHLVYSLCSVGPKRMALLRTWLANIRALAHDQRA